MKNFTLKTLALGMVFTTTTNLSAQTITYQRNEEISKQLRQSHRTVPLWGDFTKNGYMDVYYSGTSGANGWWNGVGGFLVRSRVEGYTDQSIFLPREGYGCMYWSSSLNMNNPSASYSVQFSYTPRDHFVFSQNARCEGGFVRPVNDYNFLARKSAARRPGED